MLVITVWGGNFIASKEVLAHFPPIFFTFLRFLLLCPVLLPFVKLPHRGQWRFFSYIALTGTAHFILPQMALAVQLDIATCAILTQLAVPFACLFGAFFFGDMLGKWRFFGVICSFTGMVVVVGSPHLAGSWIGSAYAITSAVFFAIYIILIKQHPDVTAMQLLAYLSLLGLPLLLGLSVAIEQPTFELLRSAPLSVYANLCYTAFISSIVGHGLWNYLLKKHPISHVAPFALLVPVSSGLMAQYFYDEPITAQLLIGGAITLMGIGIIIIRRPRLLERSKVI